MIGSVVFKYNGRDEVVILNDNGKWIGPIKSIVDALNVLCNPLEDHSPAHGVFGYSSLQEAASTLKGTIKGLKPIKVSKNIGVTY